MTLFDRLISEAWPPPKKSTGPRTLRAMMKQLSAQARERVSKRAAASFIPKSPSRDPLEAKREWEREQRRKLQKKERRGAPEKERSGDIAQTAARVKKAEARKEEREKQAMEGRNLRLPSNVLSRAIEQVGKTATRRRIRVGGKAARGPDLPPVWGYLTPEQKKEWLRAHRQQSEGVTLYDRVFVEA